MVSPLEVEGGRQEVYSDSKVTVYRWDNVYWKRLLDDVSQRFVLPKNENSILKWT